MISFNDKYDIARNILIDGGTPNTYQFKNKKGKQEAGDLMNIIEALKENGQHIDLLILTHVDDDHIGGLLRWFEKDVNAKDIVKKVWFNSGRLISEHFGDGEINTNLLHLKNDNSVETSIKQGVAFEDYIEQHNIWDREIINCLERKEELGLKFTFLSPDENKLKALQYKWEKEVPILDTSKGNDYKISLKQHIKNDTFTEDESPHNGSSIAFILDDNGTNMIFLGDAHPSLVSKSLKDLGFSNDMPVQAEFLKISHHGSRYNTSKELLQLIDTNKYIISSNGEKHQLPDKQCLARIINNNEHSEIYFNYPNKIDKIFSAQDRIDYPDFIALGIEKGIKL